jgi:hypothetical protein
MIEELKNLQPEDTILFTDEQVLEFFEEEELTVTCVKVYSIDEAEMVIVEMEDLFLIAHNFQEDEKLFAYQLVNKGSPSDLEEEGFKFLSEDDDFRHKIVIREDGKAYSYRPSETGAIYNLNLENGDSQETSICEFLSSSARLNQIIIEYDGENARILQGIEINEESFEIKI